MGENVYKPIISKSKDVGNTWERYVLGKSSWFESQAITVDPSDPQRVFDILEMNNKVTLYITENGGNSWDTVVTTGISGEPKAIIVSPSNKNKLAAGTTNGFYVSSDKGNSWTKVASNITGVYDLIQSQSKDGLLIGSANDGVYFWKNWSGTPSRLHNNSSGDDFITALVETPKGRIYAGTKSTAVWINDYQSEISDKSNFGNMTNLMTFYQIPNKNGTIRLSMDIAQAGNISIEIFDLSGRMIKKVFDQHMTQGKHNVDLDSKNLARGMYIARLKYELSSAFSRIFISN